jgi:hypothetical protein
MLAFICHLIVPKPDIHVPDSGTTLVLLSIAIGSIVFIRAKLK